MPSQAKIDEVKEYTEFLKGAKSVYLADYVGLDVASIQELRKECRENSVRFRVVKNRLMILAAREMGLEGLDQYLTGPVAVAISDLDEVTPGKVLTKFAKEHKKPALKGGYVDGEAIDANGALAFSKLPSLDEARAQLLSVLNAPATQIVRIAGAPASSLVRCISGRKDKLG